MGAGGTEAQRQQGDDPLTRRIIGAAIEVHRRLGPGMLETAYEECFAWELKLREMVVRRQVSSCLLYKGLRIDDAYRVDMIVEEMVIVELKHVERLLPVHAAQVLTYLRATGLKTGLLFNFNAEVLVDGIRRISL